MSCYAKRTATQSLQSISGGLARVGFAARNYDVGADRSQALGYCQADSAGTACHYCCSPG